MVKIQKKKKKDKVFAQYQEPSQKDFTELAAATQSYQGKTSLNPWIMKFPHATLG